MAPRLSMDPKRVEVFVRSVELGSFSALARAWRVKPSSVSRQVAALEDELGVALLSRTTRKLSLTEAGAVLFERARIILDDLDDAGRTAAEYTSTAQGKLRLSAPVALGRRYVAPLIGPFLAAHPGLDLEIDLHDRYVDLVGEGYDAAIRAGHVRDDGLVAKKLARNDRILCASPDYLKRQGAPRTPEALEAHDAVVFRYVDATDVWRLRRGDQVRAVRVRSRVASNNGDLLMEATVQGLGVALVPAWLAAEALETGRVERVLTEYDVTATDFDAHLHLLFPSRRLLPAKVRVLVAFLESAFSPPPWHQPPNGR